MLKKKKIMLMTKLAIYDKLEGKNMSKASKYFRSDYVSWHVIKTIAAVTIVYALCAALWFIYNSELIMQNIMSINYFAIIRYAVLLYVVLLLSYGAISYVVYSVKYSKAAKSLDKYEKGLKQLAKICVEERDKTVETSHDEGDGE
ncbi:MAG: hypothetical protein J6B39_09125 [Lachnospiraceae bacterium]|nr:hypothetical protein [Lachnospiraceae bacterium]